MTIDEAIAMMHEWADYECRNEEQMQASEAFNQIAVLLEELKALKSEPINCGSDLGKAYYYNLGRENGYGKAIDDFAKWLESKKYLIREIQEHNLCYTCYDELKSDDVISEYLSERLKAGAE